MNIEDFLTGGGGSWSGLAADAPKEKLKENGCCDMLFNNYNLIRKSKEEGS